MGFQVNIFFIFGWGSLCILLSSCQISPPLDEVVKYSNKFTDTPVVFLDSNIAKTDLSLISFRLELKWLKLRKEIVAAEILSNEAKKSGLILERELSKFQNLDNRFSSSHGFISDNEQIKWQARLRIKKEESNRLEARVRLLKRDMNDLEKKLSRKGFQYRVPAPESKLPLDLIP